APGAAKKPEAAPSPGAPGAPAATPAAGDPTEVLRRAAAEIEFRPQSDYAKVSFNLDEANLTELVKAISNITGRRFIFGGKLRQIQASVYAPDKITVAEAYLAFLTILNTNGLTVIPHGRFLEIAETKNAASLTTPVLGAATPVPEADRYVTRLYRLVHVEAAEVQKVLTRFKSTDGDITVYEQGNLLIITDTGSNIKRMLRIVEELDAASAGAQIWVQSAHYNPAADLAAKLNEVLDAGTGPEGRGGAGGKGAGRARIVADEANNALIIVATEADYRRLLALLGRIDVPDTGESGIQVLPLQHAQCDELSQTLNQILGGAGGAVPTPAGRAGRAGRTGATTAASGGGGEGIFEGALRVTCDVATNSLVTTSSLRDYARLRNVIDQLDRPRRQVFIEAVIMDVNVDHSTDLGLGLHGGATADLGGSGDTVFYGGVNPQQSIGLPANLEALAFGVRGPDLEGTSNLLGTGVSIPGFGVVLHALAKSGDSNLLATPHVLATDNIAAEISIGQNIPLQTNIGGLGSLAGLAGAAGATGAASSATTAGLAGLGSMLGYGMGMGFQAPRQDVGIKLKVTPHINDSDQVRFEISEEFSDAGSPTGALGAVPINKRTANTTLVVKDQQTVVIGGLVRESVINGETKVPILGDIPVLGILFRQTQKKTQKTNLLLILTPYIVRDQNDLRAIFERKMQERQEFLDRYFVFSDAIPWEPDQDWARTTGLVERIRQTQIQMRERARLDAALRPEGPKEHEPVEPIDLPSFSASGTARAGSAGGTLPPESAGAPPAPPPSVTQPRPPKLPPRLRIPGTGVLTPQDSVE
ncbi:MAG: type II secretion system secretin GspD, partial [Deltaproteobacteria bacterium]|nr:type II secretion system secretin GspD [Deltaproteobacteria bacterium]